jgi:hypothetical protein
VNELTFKEQVYRAEQALTAVNESDHFEGMAGALRWLGVAQGSEKLTHGR